MITTTEATEMATEIVSAQLTARPGVLTPRETETALWIAEGKTREEAAVILGCSPRTVGNHLASAMDKVGAPNIPALVTRLWMHGVLRARAISTVFLTGLLLITTAAHIDQARLRPGRSGGRTAPVGVLTRAYGRDDLPSPAGLGLLWS